MERAYGTYRAAVEDVADVVEWALEEAAVDYWYGSVEDIIERRGYVTGYVEAVSKFFDFTREKVLQDVMELVEGRKDERD